MPHSGKSAAERYPLLFAIDEPAQLRARPAGDLAEIARQLREFLIESVSGSGGHFAAGLGVVELSVALHYVFDTPRDKLVWDVGHMCYPHKILTGRRDSIHTIRQTGGLAPFPERGESEYDSIGVGHAGTAVSAALGMSLGYAARGQDERVVAIVGDGGMTAGMSYEALNHAGDSKANLLVVLNDNEMSISPNVGALRSHLELLASSPLYQDIAEGSERVLGISRKIGRLAKLARGAARGIAEHDNIFTALGFRYFGPIDGHDIDALASVLRNLRSQSGPRLLHLVTTKGKGYARAEANPVGYHGVSAFDPAEGIVAGAPASPSYSQLFSRWICAMAERDPRLCAVTPAMREGSGLVAFEQRFAERYHDVGIAEQHAVTLAGGMALAGQKPVLAIYSTFLQRGLDQLIHDIWLNQLDVTLAVDRAGIVGGDGATHNGSYDIVFALMLDGLMIATPSSGAEAMKALNAAYAHEGAALVRYPRGSCGAQLPAFTDEALRPGEALVCRRPSGGGEGARRLAILAFGVLLANARRAAEELDALLVDMRFARPLDTDCIDECLRDCSHIVTIEEGVVGGGAGAAVASYARGQGSEARFLHIGLPATPIPHGVREDLLRQCGLDEEGVLANIASWLDAC